MSGRRSKAIGYRWEAALVRWLKVRGWDRAKRWGNLNGQKDQGDLSGIPWVWQAKDVSELGPKKLAAFMDATAKQAGNAGLRYYGVALKRRRSSTRDGYFVMPLWMAEELMRREHGD